MSQPLVSIILPCFNERGNILELVQEIDRVLVDVAHEIVVVDDNSPDGTYQAVVELGSPNVRAFCRTHDPSFAKSIRFGIEKSVGEWLIIMDSDFNHPPKYLPMMLANLPFYDVVLGSRFVYGGMMPSRFRHICSWLFNIMVRIVTRKFVTDSLFGFLAIHRSVLNSINFDAVFWGYGDYCIRLMYYLQRQKRTILQIPVVLGQRKAGQGNPHLLKTLLKYLKATIQLVIRPYKESI